VLKTFKVLKIRMKNLKYIIILVVGTLSMQSCFVAKKYKRPNVDAENLYRVEVVARDTTTMADISWRELFKDPILQKHIEKGLQNNFDVRIAIQNILSAQAGLNQKKLGFLPALNANGSWTHQENSKISRNVQGLPSSVDQYQLVGNLSWELDIWGKIRSDKRYAKAQYLQTVAASQAVKTQIITGIASMYYQLLALDSQLAISEQTLLNRKHSLETIKALKQSGLVTEVAVKQIEAQMLATEIIVDDIKFGIKALENSISIILGDSPKGIERSTFAQQELNPNIQLGVSAQLLSRRPDVIAAEYGLVSAFEMVNVARSNFYPSVTITAIGGFQNLKLKDLVDEKAIFSNFIGGLTMPLFNQGKIRSGHKVAIANQEKALIAFERTLKVAGKEVSDALLNYQNETKKASIRQSQVEALRLASEYSEELLDSGMANYLEVLTAQDNALNAELGLIDNKYKQFNAIISLYRALGGGME